MNVDTQKPKKSIRFLILMCVLFSILGAGVLLELICEPKQEINHLLLGGLLFIIVVLILVEARKILTLYKDKNPNKLLNAFGFILTIAVLLFLDMNGAFKGSNLYLTLPAFLLTFTLSGVTLYVERKRKVKIYLSLNGYEYAENNAECNKEMPTDTVGEG